jgi:hypothetical protein
VKNGRIAFLLRFHFLLRCSSVGSNKSRLVLE